MEAQFVENLEFLPEIRNKPDMTVPEIHRVDGKNNYHPKACQLIYFIIAKIIKLWTNIQWNIDDAVGDINDRRYIEDKIGCI